MPLAMRPQGALGRAFGFLMERLNAGAYRAALAALAPRDGQRFLELGFGTGRLVELLLTAGDAICVAGVDPTPTMVEVARARRGCRNAPDRLDLREQPDVPLPWADAAFDGAAALHCFQFWPDPARTLSEIRRVLRPGAPLVLVLRDHERRAPQWLPNPISRAGNEADRTCELLERSGFEPDRRPPAGSSAVIVARRCD